MKCMCWEMPKRSPEARYMSTRQVVAKDRFFIRTTPSLISSLPSHEIRYRLYPGQTSQIRGPLPKCGPNMTVGIPDGPGPTPAGTDGPRLPVVSGRVRDLKNGKSRSRSGQVRPRLLA